MLQYCKYLRSVCLCVKWLNGGVDAGGQHSVWQRLNVDHLRTLLYWLHPTTRPPTCTLPTRPLVPSFMPSSTSFHTCLSYHSRYINVIVWSFYNRHLLLFIHSFTPSWSAFSCKLHCLLLLLLLLLLFVFNNTKLYIIRIRRLPSTKWLTENAIKAGSGGN